MSAHLTKLSKFLSLVLRHKPEEIGLTLDEQGWAEVDELIRLMNVQGNRLTRPLLEQVVAENDKQRFGFSDDGLRIRANQGHSLKIDLALEPLAPPEVLFHGTATRFLSAIMTAGLLPRSRQHVHLSHDPETAIRVGQRHGQPVVLTVAAQSMHRAGYQFFQSQNGVWLTAKVPPKFLQVLEDPKA
jgi:putative RNA 2'-phosphotransferase